MAYPTLFRLRRACQKLVRNPEFAALPTVRRMRNCNHLPRDGQVASHCGSAACILCRRWAAENEARLLTNRLEVPFLRNPETVMLFFTLPVSPCSAEELKPTASLL